MTSLSAEVANWRASSFYKYGDTVFWEGQVYILNSTPDRSPNPYIPGVPPYPSDNIWFNPAGTVIPPAIPPEAFTSFQQTGTNWDAEKQYGIITVSWTGGLPNKGYSFNINGAPIASPLGFYIDSDTNSATIYGIGPGTPGITVTVQIVALAISGSDAVSAVVPMTTLGVPVAPTISLVDYSINPVSGKGEVSITLETNATLFNTPTEIRGYAIGSTNTSGQPNYEFTYDLALGTATFSGLTGINNISPPISFKVFVEGANTVGTGPISNIILQNFNPNPPLPDNLNNLALVTFLLGGGDYTTGWSINTSGNQQIGSYDCHTGLFTEPAFGDTIRYLQARQERGVSVLLSLGGATWNVADGLTNGANLAQNIAYAFFGIGSSPSGWIRYGNTLTPPTPFTFDGLDLDWEGQGTLSGTEELNFLTQFRALCPDVILAAAPQPPYNANTNPGTPFTRSAFTAHGQYQAFPTAISPVTDFVPSNPAHPALFDINNLGFFDYVFVQYYNNPDWAPGTQIFAANVAQWAKMVQSAIQRRNSPPGILGTRFVLGLACADAQTTPLYAGATDNVFIQEALVQAQLVNATPTVQNFCAGSGFWNSPTANYPDATVPTNPFNQLYNSETGVGALADTDIIMMYCNASGINPQWQTLPLLDFEEPGVPDIPPITATINTGSRPPLPYSYLGFQITTTTPGLIALEAKICMVNANGTGAEYLAPVQVTSVGGNYYIERGLNLNYNYYLSIKGLFPTGTSQPLNITRGLTTGGTGFQFSAPNFTTVVNGAAPGEIITTVTLTTAFATVPTEQFTLIDVWVSEVAPIFSPGSLYPTNFRLLQSELLNQDSAWTFNAGVWSAPFRFTSPYGPGRQIWYFFTYNQPQFDPLAGPRNPSLVLVPITFTPV